MPVFVRPDGLGIEVIKPRPRKAEMSDGARKRLRRDVAMSILRADGWPVARIADVFSLTPVQVRNRLAAWNETRGSDDGND